MQSRPPKQRQRAKVNLQRQKHIQTHPHWYSAPPCPPLPCPPPPIDTYRSEKIRKKFLAWKIATSCWAHKFRARQYWSFLAKRGSLYLAAGPRSSHQTPCTKGQPIRILCAAPLHKVAPALSLICFSRSAPLPLVLLSPIGPSCPGVKPICNPNTLLYSQSCQASCFRAVFNQQ
jgi:hypothetical protein